MRRVQLVISLFIALAISAMAMPMAASASTEGRRNTAAALAAGTVFAALTGKTAPAIALGAGTVYAWNKYSTAHKQDVERQNYWNSYRYNYGRYHYYAPQPKWNRDVRRDNYYNRSNDRYASAPSRSRNRH